MIDEAVLERLLRDEAETYDPPEHGPDEVLAAAAEQTGGERRSRSVWLAAAAAAVLVTGGVAVSRGGTGQTLPSMAGRGANALMEDGHTTAGSPVGGSHAYDSGGGDVDPGAKQPGQGDPQVVRTGSTWLTVPDGKVRETLRAASRIAATYGGHVAESHAETADDDPSGSVTLKVPVASYDRAVEDVGRLGDVRQADTQTEDVTDQVTDNAARLRTLTATRDQLRTLLSRADSIADVLAVQGRLTEVQTQIEQLQAKQDALEERTTYGTLRVSVTGPGAADDLDRGGFSGAWDDAVDGFVGGFQGLVAASGTIAFVLLVGLVLLVAGRRAYRFWVRGVV